MNMLTALKNETNYTLTENGAVTHKSTLNKVLDLFSTGAAYRNRTDAECFKLFLDAFQEDGILAMKCLFYIRDILGGQGERRFFRVCLNQLAKTYPDAVRRNMRFIPEFGRFDDLYSLVDTPLQDEMFEFMRIQLIIDIQSLKTKNGSVSLLGKWLKSCNASSKETKRLGYLTRTAFGMSEKEYRKTLSALRERINVLERLMSANRWDEIEFDKIPSRAGMLYRNAFAYKDITKDRYQKFAQDKTKEVNAGTLYPQDIAARAFALRRVDFQDPSRLMLQKYWDNLPDYYNGKTENGLAIVDVSGSMYGTPLEAAIGLGAYIAEHSGADSQFRNHFITFSEKPELIEFTGYDIVQKVDNCNQADWGYNTNLEAVFDLLLNTAIENHISQELMPSRLYILSDMEFDYGLPDYSGTLVERIVKQWKEYGYEIPDVIFWNLNSRQNNIPAMGDKFSYISGFSPIMVEQILSGKTGIDIMLDKLNSDRYKEIR